MDWPADRRAIFEPKRRDNIRPEMQALIGQVNEWTYAGTQDAGSYAGHPTPENPND